MLRKKKIIILILLALIIFFFTNTSCQKPKTSAFKILIIELSEEDKLLLNYYNDNSTITFSGEDNQELEFITDSLYYQQIGDLNLVYTCITQDISGFSFQINLSRIPDSVLRLKTTFYYKPDWSSDFSTTYTIFPKNRTSIDTTYENGYRLKYDYYDSLTLRSEQFYNVFHTTSQEDYYFDLQTEECYYTNEFGVVAFKTHNGIFWIRKTQ